MAKTMYELTIATKSMDKEAMALNNRSCSVDTTISTTTITGSLHWGSITGNQYKVN